VPESPLLQFPSFAVGQRNLSNSGWFGRGIALVEEADDKEALFVLWNRLVLRVARKDIVLNQQNMR
jgi:hypothetical protein